MKVRLIDTYSFLKYIYVHYFFHRKRNKKIKEIKNLYYFNSDKLKLKKFKNVFKNDSCVLIGNGPSLNKVDFTKLQNVTTFAANNFYLMSEKNNFFPDFFTIEDNLVIESNIDQIEMLKSYKAGEKFFSYNLKKYFLDENINYFFNDGRFISDTFSIKRNTNIKFSKNFSKVSYSGHSVTYINLQLAYFMGFKTVYLVGMDFNYVMPKYMKQNLNLFKSNFEDKNHFYSKEFKAGDKFYNPQLNKVQIAFEKAKSVFESNNRNIINLTHGGDLTVFRRDDFNNVF